MKIRLRKADRLFSQYMRLLQDYTCQRCGKKYDDMASLRNLGVSHYFGRSRESTRYDPMNVDLLCNLPCHHYWGGEGRQEYKEFMVKKLGKKGLDKLEQKANNYCKRNDPETERILKEKIRELNGSN